MITIITPSCRQNNLQKLYESIEFDIIDKWIIVYDTSKNRTYNKIFTTNPKVLEVTCNEIGKAGHAQRNYGMNLVKKGHIYFLDDDNIIHPDFWAVVHILEGTCFYTFDQQRTYASILKGNYIRVGKIDTAMFIVHKKHTAGILWIKDRYDADGHFISEIYSKYRPEHKYINQVCCYYNYLATPQLPRRVITYQEMTQGSVNTNRAIPNRNLVISNIVPNVIHRQTGFPIKNRLSVQSRLIKKIPTSPQSTLEKSLCPFSRGYRHTEQCQNPVLN
jgi:hypothetical protein